MSQDQEFCCEKYKEQYTKEVHLMHARVVTQCPWCGAEYEWKQMLVGKPVAEPEPPKPDPPEPPKVYWNGEEVVYPQSPVEAELRSRIKELEAENAKLEERAKRWRHEVFRLREIIEKEE